MDKVRKRVLVLFGGESCEHDISIITGVLALNCIDKELYSPVPVYITEDGWYTGEELFDLAFYKRRDVKGLARVVTVFKSKILYTLKGSKLKEVGEVYCAVNCCHGLNGEDGSLAGVMRMLGIPFASPDMLSSSVCIDKTATKIFLSGMDVKTLQYKVVTASAFYKSREFVLSLAEKKIGYPCIVKPARLGSSIGISRASDRKELKEGIELALRYDGKIIVERALDGFTEVNCAAYRSGSKINISECECPKATGELLSFADKYGNGVKHALSRDFPAKIPTEISNKIKEITGAVYRKLYVTGVIRIDFLLKDGEIYLNEINTVPGSLALHLFKDKASDFNEVLTELIEEGVRSHREYLSSTFTYSADVFSCVGNKNSGAKHSTIKN